MRRFTPSTAEASDKMKAVLTPVITIAALVATWEITVRLLETPKYLVPRPSDLPSAIPPGLLYHVGVTSLETILGFVIANALAFVVAVAMAQSAVVERGVYPLAIALKTTPLVAIAPLLVLWFGTGLASKAIAAGLICFFPMVVNTVKGLRSVEPDEVELFRSLKAGRRDVFMRLQLPRSLPYVFAALKISSSLAVVGAIVGEFVGAKAGLGFLILQSSYRLNSPQLFVCILVSAALGLTLFALVGVAERRVCTWEKVSA